MYARGHAAHAEETLHQQTGSGEENQRERDFGGNEKAGEVNAFHGTEAIVNLRAKRDSHGSESENESDEEGHSQREARYRAVDPRLRHLMRGLADGSGEEFYAPLR